MDASCHQIDKNAKTGTQCGRCALCCCVHLLLVFFATWLSREMHLFHLCSIAPPGWCAGTERRLGLASTEPPFDLNGLPLDNLTRDQADQIADILSKHGVERPGY